MTDKPPHAITKLGVGRTFQNIRLFPQMTALENVLVGMHSRLKGGILGSILGHAARPPRGARGRSRRHASCSRFSGLRRVDDELAESLSYGDQRRLEVARALATEPKLLLLDEPTAGMNPQETVAFTRLRREAARASGPIAILLIEHDMKVVMGVSERVTVLDYGEKIAEGTPHEIQQDERVIEAVPGQGGDRRERALRPRATVTLLALEDVHTFYGSIEALKGISLEVHEGEIVTLIGANGAGKSTTLRSINGLNHAARGHDLLPGQGHHATRAARHRRRWASRSRPRAAGSSRA